MSYAECVVCHGVIEHAREAMMIQDATQSDDSPGRVEYRHPDCDPEDRVGVESTVVEF